MSKEKYIPSSEELKKAEEMMTEDEKMKSKERQESFEEGIISAKKEEIEILESAENKETLFLIKGAMDLAFKQNRPDMALSFAAAAGDINNIAKAEKECEDQKISCGYISQILETKTRNTIIKSIEMFLSVGELSEASRLAIKIAETDPKLSRVVMGRAFKEKKPELVGRIAVALKDNESAQKAMTDCFESKRGSMLYEAGEIAYLLGDIKTLEKAVELCKDYPYGFEDLSVKLVKMKPEAAKDLISYCFLQNWAYRSTIGEITVTVSKNNPEYAKQILDECLLRSEKEEENIELVENNAKRKWIEPITNIAVALSKTNSESSRKAMEHMAEIGLPTYEGVIAASLNDILRATRAINACFTEKNPSGAAKIALYLSESHPNIARDVATTLLNRGRFFELRHLIISLSKNEENKDFIKKFIDDYFKIADDKKDYRYHGQESSAAGQSGIIGEITAVFAKDDSYFAKEIMKKCVKKNWLYSAG